MKRISPVLLLAIFLLLACDVGDRPSTDPTEMYEKSVALISEQSFKQAKPMLEDAIRSFRDLKKNDQLIEALTFLIQTDLNLGEFRAAFSAAEQAAALMRKEGDVHGEVRLALLEGDLYAAMHMNDRAIAHYRVAVASATAFDDRNARAESELKLASILKTSDDLNEALNAYKSVLTLSQASGDRQHLAAALGGIGCIYRMQQRNEEAANSLTQAVSSISQTSNPLLIARLQAELGLLHTAQNSINSALRDFRDAINVLRRARAGKDVQTVLLFQLGHLYEQSSNLSEAKRYYREALELARSQGDRIAENYLSLFLVRCDFNTLPPDQRAQNGEKLRRSYEQLAKKFLECGHIAGEGFLYIQLGKEYERAGEFVKALDYFLKAVTLDQNALAEYSNEELHMPYQNALGMLPSHQDWYGCLGALLIKLQRQNEALKIVEYARTKQLAGTFQNLTISLRSTQVKVRTRNVHEQLHKARMLEAEYTARLASTKHSSDSNDLNALHAELGSAKQTLRKESRQVIDEHANYETLVLPSPIDARILQASIPRGTLAIEFLSTDDLLYIFAVTRSQLIVRTSVIRHDDLLQMMTEYRQLLQDPNVYSGEAGEASMPSMTRFARLSTQMYDILLRPVDDLFEKNLIIVVNSEMDGFPFHAIERQDTKGNVKYVIELTSVDYVPSLASLRYRATSSVRLQDIVAFGNPTGKNWSVDYELRDIRSFFKGARVMVGLETSWDNLKSIKADILQISTEFSQQSAEFPLGNFILSSGLMVEQSTAVPFEKLGELEAIPVIALSNQYGQGIGLSADHALLLRLNGTPDVFLNAWSADRKSAKFFSEYFFTHLANGLAPGDAYRQALLNLIRTREVSHPRSWGQFFHFGVG
ncbi:MAG: tetratricopeptide repeat protein [Ignavibacteriales bacterium]|nr:tetratricopeptide repeat protein [Ignavibacteriales bacterium]